jgi:hypothetical protein
LPNVLRTASFVIASQRAVFERRSKEKAMLGCRRIRWFAGLAFALIAAGCQSSTGGRLATSGGPSPDFGHRAPPQSEPRVEDAPAGSRSARNSSAAETLDDGGSDPPQKTANRRASWRTGKDQEPAERKPLPISDRADSSADDDLEL